MGRLQENKGKIVGGIIASALLIAIPFIYDKEGDKLEAYQDVAGVWTVCGGVTGSAAQPGVKMTQAQCRQLTQSTVGRFMFSVADLIQVPVKPETLAAHTSFAYNIGLGAYKGSKALTLTNAGKVAVGCRAMGNWYTAGGIDCRVHANGCYGIIKRRAEEIKLCLEGAQ